MAAASRGARLLRRYPILAPVPEDERPEIVRAALRHPLLLLLIAGVGFLLLPLYFDWAFALLGVAHEKDNMLLFAKLGGAVLAPIMLAVPLLSRYIVPSFIRKIMVRRGYLE